MSEQTTETPVNPEESLSLKLQQEIAAAFKNVTPGSPVFQALWDKTDGLDTTEQYNKAKQELEHFMASVPAGNTLDLKEQEMKDQLNRNLSTALIRANFVTDRIAKHSGEDTTGGPDGYVESLKSITKQATDLRNAFVTQGDPIDQASGKTVKFLHNLRSAIASKVSQNTSSMIKEAA